MANKWHAGGMQVACRRHAGGMQVACRWHASGMQVADYTEFKCAPWLSPKQLRLPIRGRSGACVAKSRVVAVSGVGLSEPY